MKTGWRLAMPAMGGGWLLCLLAASPLQAQDVPAPAETVEPAVPGQASDAWITTRVRAALVPLRRDGNADVHVTTLEGVVVLEGAVDNRLTHDRVVELAAQVRGVRSVDAKALKIGGIAPPP